MKKTIKIKIGDRVWLQIPHNGRVDFIYRNGDMRIELDEISPGTTMERFSPKEVERVHKRRSLK